MKTIEEQYQPIYKEILVVLQKKYNYMSEICRLTGELENALQIDDRVSTQMLIEMRQEELDGIRRCDKDLQLYIESMPAEERSWLEKAVTGLVTQSEEYAAEDNMILRISESIRSAWEKTVRIDKHVNQKLAGEDSFYREQKDTE